MASLFSDIAEINQLTVQYLSLQGYLVRFLKAIWSSFL